MKTTPLGQVALAVLMLTSALGADALSLGRARGAALLGRPLDLSIPAQLDAGDDAGSVCVEADVFHADTRIDASRVSVRTNAAAGSRQASIRVTSSAVVDEPVVTVYLRVGCLQKTTRRYVLLADPPADAAEPVPTVPTVAPMPLPLPAPAGVPVVSTGERSAPSGVAAAGAPASLAARLPGRRAPREGQSAAASVGQRPGAGGARGESLRLNLQRPKAAGKPRLRLESAQLPAERVPSLKSSLALQVAPSDADPRRAEAAALWRALNAQPQELLRDQQRLRELQAEALTLRSQATKSQATVTDLQGKLQEAEDGRYQNPLVYGLAAGLLALLLGGWYLRRRGAGAGAAWWDVRPAGAPAAARAGHADEAASAMAAVSPVRAGLAAPTASPSAKPGPDMPANPAVAAATVVRAGAMQGSDDVAALAASQREVNVEELFDIQQQADFFVSLGQEHQAIEVLLNHIRENAQTSPLAYLDLLKLYHKLGHRTDYDALRVEFNDLYNGQVPEFDAFSERSEGLEAYNSALSRIESLWHTTKVLDVIEESIFRKPGRLAEAFDLEAYRELLLLYAMAKDMVDRKHLAAGPDSSDPTAWPELSGATPAAASGTASRQPAAEALASRFSQTTLQPLPTAAGERQPAAALDIDLSKPAAPEGVGVEAFSTPPKAGSSGSSALLDFDLYDDEQLDSALGPKPTPPPGRS